MRRAPLVLAFLALAALLVGGCSRDRTLSCQSTERYAGATTAPPLRIPDDLNVPDETNALRIPDRQPQDEAPQEGSCLESPPDFFDGQAEG